jgi:thiamine-phosphate pyrophosphorylase
MPKIYLIGDEKYSFEHTCRALTSDVSMFQLRLKNSSDAEFMKQALLYKKVCDQRGIKFIINDNLAIAQFVNADGLHIGQDDLDFHFCREKFPNKIIGLSVGNEKEAKEAFMMGADYIGLGAIYETKTKKNANVIGLETLRELSKIATCDIVAIGGIDTSNFQDVYDAGADALAVCSAVLENEKPEEIMKILKGL